MLLKLFAEKYEKHIHDSEKSNYLTAPSKNVSKKEKKRNVLSSEKPLPRLDFQNAKKYVTKYNISESLFNI